MTDEIKPNPDNATNQKQETAQISNINVHTLGEFLDGWADVIEGMGDKVDDVRDKVVSQLQARNMPDVQIKKQLGIVSSMKRQGRQYVITTTYPGATTAIYIGKHGQDLYVSWRTFHKPIWNIILLLAIVAIPGFVGCSCSIASFVMRGDFSLLSSSTANMLTVSLCCSSFLAILVTEILLLMLIGKVVKGDPWAYFQIEPSLFDADDIIAMSLSVHKSLIRALDNAGIDVSKLRIKREFQGGRKGEIV
jgi:hypothetical protein